MPAGTTPPSVARQAVIDVAPMLVGIIPFGLVAGATPVAQGLGVAEAMGFSTVVFAGASQLAALDILHTGGSAVVAAVTAWTINLRLILYSASLAPKLAHEPRRRRLGAAYVLVDQNYAMSITRWTGSDDRGDRLRYFLAGGGLLWINWQLCTLAGALVGSRVPEDIPLTFAVPLVFLVLLIPTLTSTPAIAAAVVGGSAALATAELGAPKVAILCGAVAGIAAGSVVAFREEVQPR